MKQKYEPSLSKNEKKMRKNEKSTWFAEKFKYMR